VNAVVDFLSVDRNAGRRLKAELYTISLNGHDGNRHILADHDPLSRFPAEDEHDVLPGLSVA
jgi:hypothetical protein